jgi:hypothetical protein
MSDEEKKIKEYITMLMLASPFQIDVPKDGNVYFKTKNSVSTSTAEFHMTTWIGFDWASTNMSYYSTWQEIIRNHGGEVSPESVMSVIKAEIAEMAKKIEQKK